MKVGLLSESHGSVQRTALAAAVLKAQGCDVIIHCGDLGTEAVLAELAAAFLPAGTPVHAVSFLPLGPQPAPRRAEPHRDDSRVVSL